MNWLFEFLMRWWRVDERTLPKTIDAIAAISYGATPRVLTNGGMEAIKTAVGIYQKNGGKNTFVAWGVFTPTSDPENALRKKAFEEFGVKPEAQVYIGSVASTIEEVLKIKEALVGRPNKTIAVVAGSGHSRRARLVWKKEFSKSDVYVVSFPWWQEIQKDHPMIALRNRWTWLLVNIALHLIFLTPFGYRYFRKNCKTMRQVTVK
jgi:hypothetical protein